MWPDNETTIDLLGFNYLVDSLEVVLTDPRLLPVTVGVLGDWGSGKSSLLQMVGARLGEVDGYVIVSFSPWRYQAYEDVKAALMDAVLEAVAQRFPPTDEATEGLLRRLRHKIARIMAGPIAAGRVFAPAAGALGAAHVGLPVEFGAAAGSALVAGADAVVSEEQEAAPGTQAHEDGAAVAKNDFESVADFREEFEALVRGIEGLRAVIVLIDDLDRCLDDTVVEVFEAMRLFLQVSKTAFVIAANRAIVQAAIERRYPSAREGDPALGKDYLEKIIQVEVTVPPLSSAEAETFLNLLFADLRLNAEQMERIRATANDRRSMSQFGVAMNYGIAKDVLGDIGTELEVDFTIANRIAPTLSRGLRGNPRQLKRFLNTLLLRLETAKRRSITLEPAVLAKLMVLEQSDGPFQQLFEWQVLQEGRPEELASAERAAADGSEPTGDAATQDLQAWFGLPAVRSWLVLEPSLANVDLSTYFYFSRDRLSPVSPETRLSAELQALLGRLVSATTAQRRTAVQEAVKLGPEAFTPLYTALLERAHRHPESNALNSALELTAKVPSNWPTLAVTLGRIPPSEVPISLPPGLVTVGKDRAEVRTLLEGWKRSGHGPLVKAVGQAEKGLA